MKIPDTGRKKALVVIDIQPVMLKPHNDHIVHNPLKVMKTSRSVFMGDQDVTTYLRNLGIEEVHLVGTETNDCVLATAHSAFDRGFRPYVLEECCEALYEGRHLKGVELLRFQKLTNNSCLAKTTEVAIN